MQYHFYNISPCPHAEKMSFKLHAGFFFFLINQLERQSVRKRDKSSTCWFIPHMATTARAAPGQSQDPVTQSQSRAWRQGSDTWVAISCFTRSFSSELDRSREAWDSNQHSSIRGPVGPSMPLFLVISTNESMFRGKK